MSKILIAFQKQQSTIRSIIAKYRSNISDIDELAQDVFLTGFALEMREHIHQPEHLLLRIAKNLAINASAKKINKSSVSLEDSDNEDVYTYEGQHSPEAALAGKENLVIFANVLASLPPDQRRILVLRKVDGLKFDQIATRMNLSKSSVEKKVAIAMAACYAYYRQQGINPAEFGAPCKEQNKRTRVAAFSQRHINSERKK